MWHGQSTEPKPGDIMRYLLCILIALALAGDCWAGQIFRGSTTSGGGSTTWGPTAISITENDVFGTPGAPPAYDQFLDQDGSSLVYDGGLRWVTSIPEGATITSATLRIFIGYPASSAGEIRYTIYGHDTSNAEAYNTGDVIGDRTKTTASTAVVFNTFAASPGAWNTVSGAGLVGVIQEIVNNSGFSGSISLLMIYNATSTETNGQIHTRVGTGTDGGTNYATLEVTYE